MKLAAALLAFLALAGQAHALGLMRNPDGRDFGFVGGHGMSGGSGWAGGGGGGPNVNFAATASYTAAANPTDTTAGVAIGAPAANRQVIACYNGTGGASMSAVTIGGVSATLVYQDDSGSAIWRAAVPTGTTATIVSTFGGNVGNIGATVGVLYTSTPAPSGTASRASASYAGPPWTLSSALTIPAGGVGVACAGIFDTTRTYTLSNGTIDYQNIIGGFTLILAHATATGSWNPSFSGTAGSVVWSISAASWGP